MNDYDKAGRYLFKKDPAGGLRWLMNNPGIGFHIWIDARRLALPNQNDLTNDLVAAVRTTEGLEAVCVELQTEARADTLTRLLHYLVRLWTEPTDQGGLPLCCVSGAILDLTGRSRARELVLRSTVSPQCRLELEVLRRSLVEEKAADLVAGVAAGEVSPWQLGWTPLMQGGGEPGIIETWRQQAESRFTNERDRGDLGTLALIFATLAGYRNVWEIGLRGWNMKTSLFLDEIRAEGREEGRLGEALALLLRQGRKKFAKAPSKKQQQQLAAITDLSQLETLVDRVLEVSSWSNLLAGRKTSASKNGISEQ